MKVHRFSTNLVYKLVLNVFLKVQFNNYCFLESILRFYLNKIGVLKSSLAVLFAGTIVFFRPILKE